MDATLLDTDMLSEVLKRKNPRILSHARRYLAAHSRLAFSSMTVYEIVRGLKATGATQQLAQFNAVVASSDVIPIDTAILMRATDLWAEGKRGGHPSDDADLIIAATALETGRILITGNTAHYSWIFGLALDDWRNP
jgi:tRNA(fMet)-specific endonuclease VapC